MNINAIIEQHIERARNELAFLKKNGNEIKRSNLDSQFCKDVTKEEWKEYKEKRNIKSMKISPYYSSEEYFNYKDQDIIYEQL